MKSPSRGLDGPAYDNPVDPSGYYPADTMSAARSAIMMVGDMEGAAAAVDHAGGNAPELFAGIVARDQKTVGKLSDRLRAQ
ncbi:MAG TPA: hypothetical protein VEA17_02070 [Bordetella sp.]|nr:hypothetical protein [Bordetella sp.]